MQIGLGWHVSLESTQDTCVIDYSSRFPDLEERAKYIRLRYHRNSSRISSFLCFLCLLDFMCAVAQAVKFRSD